jgi:hypothetical protein
MGVQQLCLLGSSPKLWGLDRHKPATHSARYGPANFMPQRTIHTQRWDFSAFNAALESGNIHLLILLYNCALADRTHMGNDTVERPAWAYQLRVSGELPWSLESLCLAAEKGHVKALEFAFAHGCPQDARIAAAAASRGHLAILEKVKEAGLPLGWQALVGAVYGGDPACIEFALRECNRKLPGVVALAASRGDVCSVRLLLSKVCLHNEYITFPCIVFACQGCGEVVGKICY